MIRKVWQPRLVELKRIRKSSVKSVMVLPIFPDSIFNEFLLMSNAIGVGAICVSSDGFVVLMLRSTSSLVQDH